MGAALVPVLFAYGGWQQSNFIAEEMIDAERNLPRALVIGVTVVVAVYLLANVTYLRTLGAPGLAASTAPAADAMRNVLGAAGATVIAAGIAVSSFGFLNLVILVSPRVYRTMSADGAFFPALARLHPRYRTPGAAIVFQGAWAILLTLTGSYGQLLDYVVFGDWIFFGLVVSTLFVYRRRDGLGVRGPGSGAGVREPGAGAGVRGPGRRRASGPGATRSRRRCSSWPRSTSWRARWRRTRAMRRSASLSSCWGSPSTSIGRRGRRGKDRIRAWTSRS